MKTRGKPHRYPNGTCGTKTGKVCKEILARYSDGHQFPLGKWHFGPVVWKRKKNAEYSFNIFYIGMSEKKVEQIFIQWEGAEFKTRFFQWTQMEIEMFQSSKSPAEFSDFSFPPQLDWFIHDYTKKAGRGTMRLRVTRRFGPRWGASEFRRISILRKKKD